LRLAALESVLSHDHVAPLSGTEYSWDPFGCLYNVGSQVDDDDEILHRPQLWPPTAIRTGRKRERCRAQQP